jgi:hypothetical protein
MYSYYRRPDQSPFKLNAGPCLARRKFFSAVPVIFHLLPHIRVRRRTSVTQARACYSSYPNATGVAFSLSSAERLTNVGRH